MSLCAPRVRACGAAARLAFGLAATLAVLGQGCTGITPIDSAPIDGNWAVTIFPPGVAGGQYIATVVITGGQPEKLTGIPGIPEQLSSFGIGDIPLRGNSINLPNILVVTGTGELTQDGDNLTLEVSVEGSLLTQTLSFSARLDGVLKSEGVIEGTARLTGALYDGTSYTDPNAAIEFRMVRQ